VPLKFNGFRKVREDTPPLPLRLAAWATRKLGTNADDRARFDPRQGLVDCSDQRPEVLHSIRPCPNYNNAEGDSGEVVLEFKLAIHRQQRVDQACRAAEQLAVLHASPPKPWTVTT
jgi:hypothetical protein